MLQNAVSIASAVGAYLEEADQKLLKLLGITIKTVAPGRAVCQMLVREDMLNSGRFCHGGLIFTLADTAFAYACLSNNQVMVTLSAHVIYANAAKLDDQLTARANVVTTSGRTGSGDVEVINQNGEIIARFQGVCYRRKEAVLNLETNMEEKHEINQ